MTAFDPRRAGSGGGDSPGFLRRMLIRLLTSVFVVGSLAFTLVLIAAATGHLDTVKALLGLD